MLPGSAIDMAAGKDPLSVIEKLIDTCAEKKALSKMPIKPNRKFAAAQENSRIVMAIMHKTDITHNFVKLPDQIFPVLNSEWRKYK